MVMIKRLVAVPCTSSSPSHEQAQQHTVTLSTYEQNLHSLLSDFCRCSCHVLLNNCRHAQYSRGTAAMAPSLAASTSLPMAAGSSCPCHLIGSRHGRPGMLHCRPVLSTRRGLMWARASLWLTSVGTGWMQQWPDVEITKGVADWCPIPPRRLM
jgi:hypothetical protein